VSFYVGKGLQLAGLAGIGLALYVGLTREAMMQELLIATASAALFYMGRRIES